MLPEPLVFPVRLFTVTLIPAKTHPMPALDAVTDLITEVFDEISGKYFCTPMRMKSAADQQ